jgi:hypothetical protein
MRRSHVLFAIVLVLLSGSAISVQAQCGVERWSVKVGTDSGAPAINLGSYISTTIYNMHSSARPGSIPSTSRVAPRETTQYSLSGTLTKYKRETDSDYHLVIKDSAGRTMIIELPSLNCVGSGSPFRTGISNARAQFDAKLTATSSFKTVTAPVTVRGIGFWDFLHGQTGVAPNGIEIHPVLNISFTGPITATTPGVIASQEVPGAAALPADMVEDNDGGRVRVFRGGDPLGEVLFHGGKVIEEPRIRVVFAGRQFDAATRRALVDAARGISSGLRVDELARYGVRAAAMPLDSDLELDNPTFRPGPARSPLGSSVVSALTDDATDLDVQRLLATAVEEGRIQHLDENVVTVVVVDGKTPLAVGTTRDWLSYHSLFHPTELAMPYVVVRAGSDPTAARAAMLASVSRALIDPAGDGWF